MNKDQNPNSQPQQKDVSNDPDLQQKNQRSSGFRETIPLQEKSTVNNEDADLEQERKEAMTERD